MRRCIGDFVKSGAGFLTFLTPFLSIEYILYSFPNNKNNNNNNNNNNNKPYF